MKITINDCLTLPVFENSEILAGKNRLNEIVKKVTVLEAKETQDIEKYYSEPNMLLITGFFNTKDDVDKQCAIVSDLAKYGAAALVVYRVGEVLKVVDQRLIDTCEKVGLPLIILDTQRKQTISDILEEISQMLFYGTAEKFNSNLVTNTVFHLLNFEKYTDFPQAVRAAAINNNFQMVLLSSDFNPILTIETQYRTTVETAIRLGRERDIDKMNEVYTVIDVEGVQTYWGPVNIQGVEYYMFIVDNDDNYSLDEIRKLADIIHVAMGMWKYTPSKDLKAEFVKAMRRGNTALAYVLRDETGIDEDRIQSVFFATGFSDSENQSILDEYCEANGLMSLQIMEGDETFGIIIGDAPIAVTAKLYDQIKTIRKSKTFHVTGIDGVDGACDAFRLINESWNSAQHVFPFKRAFSKYDLAMMSNCNNIQLSGGFLKRNFLKLLDPFEHVTRAKNKQLIETLETFVLDAEMNATKTAEIMDVHANTIQYRLKRISELLGAEITASRVIPGLTLALVLKRMERS